MSDSEKEWISMRNAAVRVTARIEKLDEEWKFCDDWPRICMNDDKLKMLTLACRRGDVKAQGRFAKVSIFSSSEDDISAVNRKNIVSGIQNCKWEQNSHYQNSAQSYPFIIGYEMEHEVSQINQVSWQHDGQAWKVDTLIDFELDRKSVRSKKLDAQPWSVSSETCLAYDRPAEWRELSTDMPEFHVYFGVEIELGSLNKWIAGSGTKMVDKSDIQKRPGRMPDPQWKLIDKFIEDKISKGATYTTKKEFASECAIYLESMGVEKPHSWDNMRAQIKNKSYAKAFYAMFN